MTNKQCVITKSKFEIDKTFDDEKFLRVRINAMTTEDNYYEVEYPESALRDSEESWKNVAILARVVETTDDKGNLVLDYNGHDMHVEENEFWDGENPDEQNRMIYDETIVGIIPETNEFEVVQRGEYFDIYVTGYIYREYGNYVADILEARGGEVDVSSELWIDDVTTKRDEKTKKMKTTVNAFRATGVTLLGAKHNPAMPNAKAVVYSQDDMMKIMQELKQSLDNYTAYAEDSGKKGGIQELAKKKIENEASVDELVDAMGTNENESENSTEETVPATDTSAEAGTSETEQTEVEGTVENEAQPSAEVPSEPEVKSDLSIVKGTYTYDISYSDMERAISDKVDSTYGNEYTWLWSEVFAEPTYVVMHESVYNSEDDTVKRTTYRQSYDVTDGVVSLLGERVEVHPAWLTDDEQKAVDELKSNYNQAIATVAKYEEEPKKMEMLLSDDYALCVDSDEFKALLEQKNHFDLSMEELTDKANEILLKSAKKMTFEKPITNENPKVGMKAITSHVAVCKNYGSLFDGI